MVPLLLQGRDLHLAMLPRDVEEDPALTEDAPASAVVVVSDPADAVLILNDSSSEERS